MANLIVTHFLKPKAYAPGHKLELSIATAYWGTRVDDSLQDHGGMWSTSK